MSLMQIFMLVSHTHVHKKPADMPVVCNAETHARELIFWMGQESCLFKHQSPLHLVELQANRNIVFAQFQNFNSRSFKSCSNGCTLPCASLLLFQVWLQEFAWTEADKPIKLEARSIMVPKDTDLGCQPMFCFETMMKLLYWSCFVYDHMRVCTNF